MGGAVFLFGLRHPALEPGWSEVLVLRWGPLGELTMMNMPWSPKFSSSPVAQILCSHHRGLGPAPGLGNQTLQAKAVAQKEKKYT